MATQKDSLATKLDGKKVMVISGPNRYLAGRVLRRQGFLARGRLTLTIRNLNRTGPMYLFATPKQVELLD